jgi:hypothetical protein
MIPTAREAKIRTLKGAELSGISSGYSVNMIDWNRVQLFNEAILIIVLVKNPRKNNVIKTGLLPITPLT